MAISLVQQLFGQENNVAAFQTNTLVTPTTVGNTLIAVVTCFKTGAADPAIAMSDSKTNTWSVASAVRSTTGGGRVYIFSAPITTSQASHQVTATANATAFISLSVWEFSGLTASPIGQSTGTTGSSTAGASGNITTTTKNNLYIGAGTVDTAAITFTAGNAFLKKDQVTTGQDLYSEYKIDRAITTGALFTWSSTTAWAVSVASFNAADDSPAPQWVMSNRMTGPQGLRGNYKSQINPWFVDGSGGGVNASIVQVGGIVTAGGGTQTVASVQNVTISQVAAVVTATGGTPTIATVNNVSITQIAGAVTATGGSQGVNSVQDATVAQLAGTVTATGGTQVVVTLQTVAITQVAANVTATGGTQVAQTNGLITQVGATVTASGGTQTIATVNNVSISQIAGSVTAGGGTQTIATVNNGIVAQIAGNVTTTGGTQSIDTINNSSIAQSAANVTATGGVQTLTAQIDAAIAQLAALVTTSGGTQSIFASSGATNVSIAQLAGNVTATGGTQVISTSTGPLPRSRTPSTIFLTDGHVAVKLGGNIYLPL